jgi:hypothetical protein
MRGKHDLLVTGKHEFADAFYDSWNRHTKSWETRKTRGPLSPPVRDKTRLEVELRAELDQPTGIYRLDLAKGGRLYVVLDARVRTRSIAELRVIERVVTFESQLQILGFVGGPEIDVLLNGHVPVIQSWTMEAIAGYSE